ncbi:MAG TPA: adenine phosphoribosyltransferase [Sedimentisphaerales bacterium]|nr:adenine phosphoribosyltransferase [Sedimentisphaerales bacterium]
MQANDLKSYIREVPDWPKAGILFYDITTLLENGKALKAAIDYFCDDFTGADIDYIAAVEARGFIFGPAVAERLGVGFIPVRKKGKLPFETESVTYGLEYGKDTLEVHRDAIVSGPRILMIDDLLATGGTMKAACELIEKIGGEIVGINFLIELGELGGREKLSGYNVNSLICY